jgi:galactose oxidase-like protein
MQTVQSNQTSALLDNGNVLISGGIESISGTLCQDATANAQLYNVSTKSFASAGDLTVARDGHTATVLNGGTVLIAGGYSKLGDIRDPCTSLPAAGELYNPSTGQFTATSSNLVTPRYYHTATLLNNGMVLIVGGYGATGYLASAELYNPATGTFTPAAGNLNTARESDTATLLNNGTVLIAGGNGSAGILASAELYSPAAGSFTATAGSLNTARELHTATLLNNGTVLIAGGYQGGVPPGLPAVAPLPALRMTRPITATPMESLREQQRFKLVRVQFAVRLH